VDGGTDFATEVWLALKLYAWRHGGVNMEGQQLTLRSALGGDIARLVDLDLGALPLDVKVRLDGHVVCRRGEEALVGRGAEGRSTRAECRKRCGAKLVGLHDRRRGEALTCGCYQTCPQ
jgi:hypothetical protein